MTPKNQLSCWVVTSGVVGMENQCIGLAAALGVEPVIKRIKLRSPWKQLAPFFRGGLRWAFSEKGDSLAEPWPDLLIASGRAGAMACLLARRQSGKTRADKTFTVYIQNPVISPSRFDLVALPRHDHVLGENVITTRGSLHRVTPALLDKEREAYRAQFEPMRGPRIAVLIGGANAVFRFSQEDMARLAGQLASVAKEQGASLLITPSRRTGAGNIEILHKTLKGVPHMIWDGTGPNPYYGMLAWADHIIVTADSVNMTSEACTTGKPVHVVPLFGGSEKFRLFHQTLRDDGLTRPFLGKLENWKYQPLNDVELVAQRVREMMAQRQSKS